MTPGRGRKHLALNIGVIDQLYTNQSIQSPIKATRLDLKHRKKAAARRAWNAFKRFAGFRSAVTTAMVATWLENKYHVYEVFYELHKREIDDALRQSVQDAAEAMAMGGTRARTRAGSGYDPFGAATSRIERMFKKFLSDREMENLGIEGVPTTAALRGVNPRKKSGFNKGNARRPSFIASGLYQASTKVWVE